MAYIGFILRLFHWLFQYTLGQDLQEDCNEMVNNACDQGCKSVCFEDQCYECSSELGIEEFCLNVTMAEDVTDMLDIVTINCSDTDRFVTMATLPSLDTLLPHLQNDHHHCRSCRRRGCGLTVLFITCLLLLLLLHKEKKKEGKPPAMSLNHRESTCCAHLLWRIAKWGLLGLICPRKF